MKKDMTEIESQRFQASVKRIRVLLAKWLEAGIELFLEMREVEREGDWMLPGYEDFSDYLRDQFRNALGFERYGNVIQAIELHGVDFVKTIGARACHAVSVKAIAESPTRQKLLQASVYEHIETQGSAPRMRRY